MTKLRLVGFFGALMLAAMVGGDLIGAALAATPSTTASDPPSVAIPTPSASTPAASASPAAAAVREPSAYCRTFRTSLAANLGVTEEQLVTAAKGAIGTAIDQAVTARKLTTAQAARLKAKVAAADADGCRILSGLPGLVGRAALGAGADALAAAADALDMAPAALRAAMRDDGSLRAVAEAKGVDYTTVSAAVLAAVRTDADARVATGDLTRAQADRIVSRVEHRLAEGWPVRPKA